MRRIVVLLTVAAMLAATMAFAQPASAQGGGCKAFGQFVAGLATTLGPAFGATASGSAPLNDTVETEQNALCP